MAIMAWNSISVLQVHRRCSIRLIDAPENSRNLKAGQTIEGNGEGLKSRSVQRQIESCNFALDFKAPNPKKEAPSLAVTSTCLANIKSRLLFTTNQRTIKDTLYSWVPPQGAQKYGYRRNFPEIDEKGHLDEGMACG
jgi:hypothetical protein